MKRKRDELGRVRWRTEQVGDQLKCEVSLLLVTFLSTRTACHVNLSDAMCSPRPASISTIVSLSLFFVGEARCFGFLDVSSHL